MSWSHIYYITSVILYIYSGYVTASEYYVSAAPNGEDCPSIDLPCHKLSYYAADYASYFTDDTIFYFLEGTHILQDTLEISGVSNITLQGLGHIEQGFHETVMQSTSVIWCKDYNRTSIRFISSRNVVLESLTIANCGEFDNYQGYIVSLLFFDINIVTLEWVSVQNNSGYGIYLVNVKAVLITNSSFANNGAPETFGGNALNYYYDQVERLSRVNIVKSNFTMGLGCGMTLLYYNETEADVIINNSIFSHNTNMHSGGGGVSIGLHQGDGSIKFSNCMIYNNNAQRFGGGIGINISGNGSIEFSNCNICNNNVQRYGGGVDIYLSGSGSIEFDNCAIHNNTAQRHGGGVLINFYSQNIEFRNCTISNNIAQLYGGGAFIDTHGNGRIEFCNSTIYNNTAIHGLAFVLHDFRAISKIDFLFKNVLVNFNKVLNKLDVYQSAVALVNVDKITFDQIEVSNHNTTGLVSFNSLITFAKNSTFVNNSGIYGGGIALYESSRLLLKEYTNVSFINNRANKSGGGIYVSQVLGFSVDFTTDCTFEVIPQHNSDDNNTVLYFVNNKADISGDVLYGGKINKCLKNLFFDHLFYYPEQTGLSVISSEPVQVCFCESSKQNCSITNISILAIPGIDVNVSLAIVGLRKGLTKGMIKFTSSDSSLNVKTDNSMLNATCTNVSLKLSANPHLLNATKINVTLKNSIDESFHSFQAKIIDITIKSCPIGYPLVNDACTCRSELNTSSITCDINTQIITRRGNMWIGYKNDSNCLIVYPHCPFDYCNDGIVLFKIIYPDPQCLLNRSGLLCGQCAKNFSLMLGSNQCGQCTNNYLALIIPFALAGIALVAFVIALNLTVSVGTINGLIFYANVVKIYEPIFFPEGPIHFLSQFISWINLDLGIETCFFDGMDSCTKTWLQFIFPAYVWFLLILIIILLRYSSKVVRLVGRQAIPVLATMILLSYTKLIRTVFLVLHFTNILCSGDNYVTFNLSRWYIDANVQYVRGCHIPLFLFSVAVLILLIVPYTFYLLTIPLLQGPLSKYMCCQKLSTYMKPFFDAYGGPYKDKCRFWTGFLLLVRVVLALTVSVDTKATVSLNVLTSILVVINFMYLPLRGVYRQIPFVCLELFFILNLILMAYINAQTFTISKRQVSTIVLVSLAFVVFCGILIYHVWDRFLKAHLQERMKQSIKTQSDIPSNNDKKINLLTISSDISIPSSIMPELREPLLDDEDDILHNKII